MNDAEMLIFLMILSCENYITDKFDIDFILKKKNGIQPNLEELTFQKILKN